MMNSDFASDLSKKKNSIEYFKNNNLKSYSCAKNWLIKALLKTSQSTKTRNNINFWLKFILLNNNT